MFATIVMTVTQISDVLLWSGFTSHGLCVDTLTFIKG